MLIRWNIIKLVILGFLISRTTRFVYGTDSSSKPETPTATSNESKQPASNKTAIELDIKGKKATEQYTYNKSGNVGTYEAKDNYAFNKVKTGSTEIWSTSDSKEYATKVVVNGIGKKSKTVTIHLSDNKTKKYKREGKDKPWTEMTIVQDSKGEEITLVGLNPLYKQDYVFFNCQSSGNIYTYTPKEGHAFNDVFEKKSGRGGYTLDIWKGENNEYSTKVEYDENAKTVTIHLSDNETKKYKREGGDGSKGQWKEEGSSQGADGSQGTPTSVTGDGSQGAGTPAAPTPASGGTPATPTAAAN